MKRKVLIALLLAPIPSAFWWLGGYNFDERGLAAFGFGICTLTFIIAPLIFPE